MRKNETLFPDLLSLLSARSKQVGDCIEYTGSKDYDGYGLFKFAKKQYRAHRAAYEVFIGAIPDGLCVMHSCDNPSCINPNHLSVGTNAENQNDKVIKGRHAKGMVIGLSRLSEQDIIDIRLSEAPWSVIRDKYQLSVSHLNRILNGDTWTHVIPNRSVVTCRRKVDQRGENNPNYKDGRRMKSGRVARSVADVFCALDGVPIRQQRTA